MPENISSQNSNELYDNPYTPGGYEKSKLRKILVVIVVVLLCVGILALIAFLSKPDKNTESATAAARKVNPNAQAADVKVAGNFAIALVSDPTSNGQAKAGNMTVFKVNKDGSMTQIASGSSFSPIDLLELGMPLTTQAKLTGGTLDQVKKDLSNTCDYQGGNAPGYSGFSSSFNPGGWHVSSLTFDSLQQAVTSALNDDSTSATADKKIVCVNAIREGSSNTEGVFTIQVEFITGDGTITKHTLTYTIDRYSRSFTLDGKKI